MITCAHCGSTSVLRDEAFHLAGEGGVMQEAPSLVQLGEHVQVGKERFTLLVEKQGAKFRVVGLYR